MTTIETMTVPATRNQGVPEEVQEMVIAIASLLPADDRQEMEAKVLVDLAALVEPAPER